MSWWAVAFQALGSALSSRSSSKGNNDQMDAMRRMQEMEMAQQRNVLQYQRRTQLADRRYNQESMGNYRQFNRTPGIVSPEYSSTEPEEIALPQGVDPANRPRNNQQGLMFFR